jgi:tRNA-splicing ligase RtcB
MPDAHVGKGATVGSVIPTDGAIVPAAVGVDIGCGMIALETRVRAEQLPDDLTPLLHRIERAIPAGVGRGHDDRRGPDPLALIGAPRTELTDAQLRRTREQYGSLGSGNHFFEVCVDERDVIWVVLHSGSRGIGNQLAQAHVQQAKRLAEHAGAALEDPDLASLHEGTDEFDTYIADMQWAQRYARANRDRMMDLAVSEVAAFVGVAPDTIELRRINCHHNFTEREQHHGRELWVTRKGAIRAGTGDLGVIPGSMGTSSYIVRGLGNAASFESCSHGAGRRLSRTKARKRFGATDLADRMAGRTWNADRAAALVDEIPDAYKDIDQVMADQADLVEVQHTLHQVLNYKG